MSGDDAKAGRATLLAVFLGTFPLTLLEGLVLRDYWNWFIRYAIPAAPRLNYWAGVALSIGVGILILDATYAASQNRPDDKSIRLSAVFNKAGFLLLAWGIGALWHLILPAVAS